MMIWAIFAAMTGAAIFALLWPLGPIAWIVGAKAKREMRAEPGRWRSSGSLTTGVVLGVITTVLMVLMTLAILFFVFLVAVASR